MSPHQIRTYTLTLSGEPDDDFLPAHCPDGAALVPCGGGVRLENLHTDQAGILGIFRALHNLGLTVLELNTSVERISQ